MTQPTTPVTPHPISKSVSFLIPTISKQSWGFMLGSSLFAVGAAMGIWDFGSTNLSNFLCFIGAWFFTAAGLYQLVLSGAPTVDIDQPPGRAFRAVWLVAASQSLGTILFNVSTTAALKAGTVADEKHLVWNPDAGGSVLFLVSGYLVYIAYYRDRSTYWEPGKPDWWSCQINMLGCIAFAVSAVGSFVMNDGGSKDPALANWGTFIGALCFFLSSAIALPKLPWNQANA